MTDGAAVGSDKIARSATPTPTQAPPPTSNYPFHPDQLDPAAANDTAAASSNDVKWYYSNYNSENIDPFVSSPSRSEASLGSGSLAAVAKPVPATYHATALIAAVFTIWATRI